MMTREEAIEELERLLRHWDLIDEGIYDLSEHDQDAVEIALAALRPVSREKVEKVWNPCNFCAGAKYITGGVTAVYPVSETRQQETLAEGDFDFCPVCGRPITDEAVDMMMERLEALKDGSTTDKN